MSLRTPFDTYDDKKAVESSQVGRVGIVLYRCMKHTVKMCLISDVFLFLVMCCPLHFRRKYAIITCMYFTVYKLLSVEYIVSYLIMFQWFPSIIIQTRLVYIPRWYNYRHQTYQTV